VEALVGAEVGGLVAGADHRPGFVALNFGTLLRDATEKPGMGCFAFQHADREW
jgi:hypothetical protein